MTAIAGGVGAGSHPDALVAAAAAVEAATAALGAASADLAVVFLGAGHAAAADAVAALVRDRSRARHLVGGTVGGVIAGTDEHEHGYAVAVWLACLPGAEVVPLRYPPPRADADALDDGWTPPPSDSNGVVLLADPVSFPAAGFCAWLAQARPGVTLSGGLATGLGLRSSARLLLDDLVVDGGAVGVSIGGDVAVRALVSQGCRPIGDPYVVTRAQRNLIVELAGRPAVERLRELYAAASDADRALLREGLQLGVVVDEHLDDPGTGDYLVRAVLGAERDGGGIVVGDVVEVGRSVRFHVRDAASADADLRALLARYAAGPRPDTALLFTCTGRGAGLFGSPHHDARAVRDVLGDVALGGCFCGGELGPIGGRSHLHGYSASLAGLVPASALPAPGAEL